MVEDWVLIEAAKRAKWSHLLVETLRVTYQTGGCYPLLCDMIAKYEQPPVDPDVRLVADIVNAFQSDIWIEADQATQPWNCEHLDRAVAVYKASKE